MRKLVMHIILGVIAGVLVSVGICLYLFSYHDNDDLILSKIHIEDDIIKYCYYNEKDGYLYGDDWDNIEMCADASQTAYMRDTYLIFNGEIKKGEYILKIYDEDGKEVFNHSFAAGTYDYVKFPLGELGYGYIYTNKISVDFDPGTAEWGIGSRCKGYDRILKKK